MNPAIAAGVVQAAHGQTLSRIAKGILEALDPDAVLAQAEQGKPGALVA